MQICNARKPECKAVARCWATSSQARMPRFWYVLNNADWSGHLLWQKLCAAALLPRHGLVAMAFLNTKARLSGPFRIILGLALKGNQPSNPSPMAPQAFVAHWPGGLHPLYGTNPMVRRWLVLCGCWDRLPDPKGHTLNFKPTAFLHVLFKRFATWSFQAFACPRRGADGLSEEPFVPDAESCLTLLRFVFGFEEMLFTYCFFPSPALMKTWFDVFP